MNNFNLCYTQFVDLLIRDWRCKKLDTNIIKNAPEISILNVHKKNNKFLLILSLLFKRIFDIFAGIIGAIILIPLSLIIFILNLISGDSGSLFYSQKRIGKNGEYFKMYKFRTMCLNSDKKLDELLANSKKLQKEWDDNRKLKNDPRVTKVGKFLRKTSLDEWSQFLNVLLGQMSLVGPRAVVSDEIEKFGIYKNIVFSVKPGITGYWAANGRSNTTYPERVLMEYKYVTNFSLMLDFKILIKTILSILKKDGAI